MRFIRSACLTHRELTSSVKTVAVTGHTPSLVAVDHAGNALSRVILHEDVRAQASSQALAAIPEFGPLAEFGGVQSSPEYFLEKVMWLRANQPRIYEAAAAFLFPQDYVTRLLTGKATTDISNASKYYWFAERDAEWRSLVVARLGLDPCKFPRPIPPGSTIGEVSRAGAALSGLPAGAEVVCVPFDETAAAIGGGIRDSTTGVLSLGTSHSIRVATKRPHLSGKMAYSYRYYSPFSTLGWLTGGVLRAPRRLIRKIRSRSFPADGLFLPVGSPRESESWVWFGSVDRRSPATISNYWLSAGLWLGEVLDEIRAAPRHLVVAGGSLRRSEHARLLAAVLGLPLIIPDDLEITMRGACLVAQREDSLGDRSRPEGRMVSPETAHGTHFKQLRLAYHVIGGAIREGKSIWGLPS